MDLTNISWQNLTQQFQEFFAPLWEQLINWGASQEMGEIAIIILSSLAFFSIISMPIMAISGQTLSLIRNRSSYAKCAKQITVLAMIIAWILCFIAAIPFWFRVLTPLLQNIPEPFLWNTFLIPLQNSIFMQVNALAFALIFAGTIFLSIYHSFRNTWKEKRVFVHCIAIIASCWFAMSCLMTLNIVIADKNLLLGIDYPSTLDSFLLPSLESDFWNAGPYILPLSISLGGALASIWLILRRNRDDFGRDYYAQMLPWCAVWARNGWLLMWLILVVTTLLQWINMIQQVDYLSNPEFMRSIAFLFLWLIPGILWTIVIKSKFPLRHKMTLVLAFFLGMGIVIPIYMGI